MSATIQNYYRKLDDLRRIAGASNEGALRSAFQTLLETIGSEHQLILYNEYPFKAPNGASLRADGVLMDSLRQIHGWWEAKDEKDDLNKEIEAKLAKGYPRDNIIFEDTRTAVLMQNGEQAMTCSVNDAAQLQRLLNSFFDYESPEVASFRLARAKFLTELPQVAAALTELLSAARRDNAHFRQQSDTFLQLCKRSIGERVTAQNVDEMLIQHILTDQIFRAVFPDSRFHAENHLARAIGELENSFFRGETRVLLLKRLEPYFAAIRQSAARTQTSADKQDFLKHIYEDFYSAYNPKDADKLGVVYTPKEAVRFMIEACDWLTQKHFNKRLSDSGLEILDPCMGTGTFIVDLLDYWRGDQQALSYKFANELHANEISILPYYIASLNIEQTYYEITGQWREFSGACFVNTLDNWGFEQTHSGANMDIFGSVTDENHARIEKQNARKIPIIIGNPPYNANQQNENDNNKNDAAPAADRRIKETYLADSTAQKTKLYDPYLRFFRWASDRLGEEGVLAFITNRSYLDSRQADGFRKTVAKEFQEIWIVDLMSDVRKNPKISGTKHNIFGIQAGVAIAFLVRKKQESVRPELVEGRPFMLRQAQHERLKTENDCEIHYLSLDDFLLATEKRDWLKHNSLRGLFRSGEFKGITPNAQGNWLNQPQEDWSAWLPVASKDVKAGKGDGAIFKLQSLGISTNRDEWLYSHSEIEVAEKTRTLIEMYQAEQKRWGKSDHTKDIENFVNRSVKWTTELTAHLVKGTQLKYQPNRVMRASYRPFVEKFLYYDRIVIHRTYQQTNIFPIGIKAENLVIGFIGDATDKPFSVLVSKTLCDLNFLSPAAAGTKTLPLYSYAPDGSRHDNITDWALKQFQAHYENPALVPTRCVGMPSHRAAVQDAARLQLHSHAARGNEIKFKPRFELQTERETENSESKPWFVTLSKTDIFNYVYAVLHDPRYREKFALNLKTEFPRIPFHPDFAAWATLGAKLIKLHAEFEQVEPWDLERRDAINHVSAKCQLKADKPNNTIHIDTHTQLNNIPPEAWQYQLGNRSALEWVLDQYKEKTPKDPTIREKFNTYRFADHKEPVIELLAKVCRVSVETMALIDEIQALAWD